MSGEKMVLYIFLRTDLTSIAAHPGRGAAMASHITSVFHEEVHSVLTERDHLLNDGFHSSKDEWETLRKDFRDWKKDLPFGKVVILAGDEKNIYGAVCNATHRRTGLFLKEAGIVDATAQMVSDPSYVVHDGDGVYTANVCVGGYIFCDEGQGESYRGFKRYT